MNYSLPYIQQLIFTDADKCIAIMNSNTFIESLFT